MKRRRAVGWVMAAPLALGLAACGGDGPGRCPEGQTGVPPNCVAIAMPDPCTQRVIESGNGSVEPWTLYFNDFSWPETGRLDITVDWTVPSSQIGVYVVPANTCTIEEINARSCSFLVRTEPSPSAAKPLKLSVPNVAAGNYRWLIGNASDNSESLAFQFVLSKGPCSPHAGGRAGATARAGEAPAFRQAVPRR